MLHGYYTNVSEAKAMQKALNDVYAQTVGSVIALNYKSKKTTTASTAGNGDFWETGKNTSAGTPTKENKPVKKDDFWNN